MTNCPACGSPDIHRSRSASPAERARKLVSRERPHRCHACGWRGWGRPSAHPLSAVAASDGWQAAEMDLSQLDAEAAAQAAQRVRAQAAVPSSPRRRHSSARGSQWVKSSEFNRRLQLVLFVALLLIGLVVMMRACSGGSRGVEPDAVGQAGSV